MGGCLTRRLGANAASGGSGDPYIANVVLLLGCEGTNGSTTVPDESPAAHGNGTITGLNNDAKLSTSVSKFGSSSLRFDGTNDSVTWADSADWSFSNGAFTVEGWFYFDSAAIESNAALISHWQANISEREWALRYRGDLATNILQFDVSSDGTASNLSVTTSAWSPTASTWYHIAVDRSGDVFRIYVDGVMLGTATNSITMFGADTILRLATLTTDFFQGNMDEIRITKGVARYASDGGYTVPTTAFPRS